MTDSNPASRQGGPASPQRLCSACWVTVLSRYNPDMLCGPCVRTARSLPGAAVSADSDSHQIPVWVWDSPMLRDALARLDLGAVLAIFRAAAGLSQQELGDLLGCSQSNIWRIEAGKRQSMYDIRELLRFADTVAMPRQALLPLIMGTPGIREDQIGIAAEIADTEAAGPATEAGVRYLRACARQLHAQEQAAGGASVRHQAIALWRGAVRLTDEAEYGDALGHDLMRVTGELAIRAAWACHDSDDQARARALFNDGLQRARQAGDDMLAVHAILSLSLLHAEMAAPGLARQAVWLTAQAAGLARREPSSRLHAMIAAREALALAALGDRGGFKAAITRAWRELDHDQGNDDPAWLTFVGPAEIAVQEAKGCSLLRDSNHQAILQNSLCDTALTPRNVAIYRAQHAADLATSGDLDQAASEAIIVLDALDGPVASPRTLARLRPVRAAAERAGLADFCARFDAVGWPVSA